MKKRLVDVTVLCDIFGCNKSTGQFAHSEMYDKLFVPFRDKPITLLEIGVNCGRSMSVWKHYFSQASIYGIDIKKRREMLDRGHSSVVKMIDQSDVKRLTKFAKENGPFDIIIDDGSHMMSHQISSFEVLWPYVTPEGLYIIEDTETSYIDKYIDSDQTCVEYFQGLVDTLNKKISKRPKLYREIDTIMFRYNAIVVTKR